MSAPDTSQTWRFAAEGKHPVAKDFIRLGETGPFAEGFAGWVEGGYTALTSKAGPSPEFCSWRFWTKGAGKDSLTCGVIRENSDSVGRPYPFFIIGSGPLRDWEEHWDLLPFACENTWCQLEYLATHRFDDVKKLEAELANIRPPSGAWKAHEQKRRSLNEIGSPLDPYASFLDLDKLKKQAAGLADQTELFVSLERGAHVDKILQISLWHHLFRESLKAAPNALFLGGTLEKAWLAAFKRSLSAPDFVQLWSVSSAGLWQEHDRGGVFHGPLVAGQGARDGREALRLRCPLRPRLRGAAGRGGQALVADGIGQRQLGEDRPLRLGHPGAQVQGSRRRELPGRGADLHPAARGLLHRGQAACRSHGQVLGRALPLEGSNARAAALDGVVGGKERGRPEAAPAGLRPGGPGGPAGRVYGAARPAHAAAPRRAALACRNPGMDRHAGHGGGRKAGAGGPAARRPRRNRRPPRSRSPRPRPPR